MSARNVFGAGGIFIFPIDLKDFRFTSAWVGIDLLCVFFVFCGFLLIHNLVDVLSIHMCFCMVCCLFCIDQ